MSDASDERLEEQFVKIKGRKIYVVLGNIFGYVHQLMMLRRNAEHGSAEEGKSVGKRETKQIC